MKTISEILNESLETSAKSIIKSLSSAAGPGMLRFKKNGDKLVSKFDPKKNKSGKNCIEWLDSQTDARNVTTPTTRRNLSATAFHLLDSKLIVTVCDDNESDCWISIEEKK